MNVCCTALKREFDKITVNRSVKSTCGMGGVIMKSWFPLPQEMYLKMLIKL